MQFFSHPLPSEAELHHSCPLVHPAHPSSYKQETGSPATEVLRHGALLPWGGEISCHHVRSPLVFCFLTQPQAWCVSWTWRQLRTLVSRKAHRQDPHTGPHCSPMVREEEIEISKKTFRGEGGENKQNMTFFHGCICRAPLIKGSWVYWQLEGVRFRGCATKTELSLCIPVFSVVLSGHWLFVLRVSLLQPVCSYGWLCGSVGVFFFLLANADLIDGTEMFVLSSSTIFYVMPSIFLTYKIFYFFFIMVSSMKCTESSTFLVIY